jgi:hypothetical protein
MPALKRNPVPASSRVRARNALTARERAEFEQASQLFADFSGHDAAPWKRVKIRLPATAIVVGRCDGVLYTTVRDSKTEKYIHRFKAKDAPALCASPDGRQLFLVGGSFEFTERGIVDDSATE